MNQPIRCEPLPFLGVTGKAAGEARPCTGEASESSFGEVLDAELGDAANDRTRAEKKRPSESEALAAYGAGAPIVQPQPQPASETTTATTNGEAAADPQATIPSSSKLQGEIQRPNSTEMAPDGRGDQKAKQAPAEDLKQIPALPRLIPAEQKVPLTPPVSKSRLEQIASNLPEPAKIARGMVAAQAPPMLLPSPGKEEKSHTVGIEHFEASSFDQPIRLENFRRDTAPAKQFNAELSPVEAFQPEMPQVETALGDLELQPVRPVEPASLVEAIRTHVELLKSSAADKLDVVLRPDAHTAIRLQVETVNGIIQVQARCERGDFALLDAHWGTIQNSLANQGVRVEPLQQGNGAQFQQNSQSFQDSMARDSKQQSREGFLREELFIEQELSIQQQPRSRNSRSSAVRGWQSWA